MDFGGALRLTLKSSLLSLCALVGADHPLQESNSEVENNNKWFAFSAVINKARCAVRGSWWAGAIGVLLDQHMASQ